MLIRIPAVLDPAAAAHFRGKLENADWQDGRGSAGYLSRSVKHNAQLPDEHPAAKSLGAQILQRLENNALFNAASLPSKIVPPLFNRYAAQQSYGRHVDGAIRPVSGTPLRVRTDLSATLFLTPPEDYEGGALLIEDALGQQAVKLAAGDMVLYPSTSVHEVEPVVSGVRLAAFFWIQSMVRSNEQRRLLFELDNAIQQIATDSPGQESLVDLAAIYHNLLRFWADS